MRVCFVSFEYPPDILGGAGTYGDALVKGLKRVGVEVYVITRGKNHSFDENVFRVPTSDSVYWRRLFFMRSAMSLLHRLNKYWKFDLVHFNEPHIILQKPDLPTVCTMHSTQINEIKTKFADLTTLKTFVDTRDLVLKSSVGSIFDVFTTHVVNKIICPSSNLARLIESHCFVDGRKIHVIPNGVDLEAFDEVRDCDTGILSKFGLEADNYVLFVGRLSILKGIQYLIEAFRSIREKYANLKLVIVGIGDLENYLRDLAHGIEGVVFTGYADSLRVKKVLYENSLVVVVPSLVEALPMVILEAMACSKPVIASNVGDIPSLIKHGKNGFLAKPGDSKSLEKFIKTLYENPNLRKSMSSFGRKLVEREYSAQKMAEKTLKVYESLFY